MTTAAHLAFWFHSALCVAYLGLLGMTAAGLVRVQATDTGPECPDWGEKQLTALLYAAGALFLAYAELYLYQVQAWSRL